MTTPACLGPMTGGLPLARLLGLAAALALGISASAHAANTELLADAEAKSEYAYFTADRHALAELLAELKPLKQSSDPLDLYGYAHASFRRLQLAAIAHVPHEAELAGDECLDALDREGAALAGDAESLALAAGCAGYLAEFGGIKHLTAGRRRDASLEAARALAPANPRVLLTAGILGWFKARSSPAERLAVRTSFTRAAELFDRVAATAPGAPTWGGAEAWLFVGRGLEADGDLVGARSAYERALLIAPDFAVARRHLARLAAPR